MRDRGITYFENSRRATLAQRAYCIANPLGHTGYSDSLWGITACDTPTVYKARGAPPAENDDGTITPTAPISSIPFAPEAVIPVIHKFWNTYRPQLWTKYGFRDAFHLGRNWWDPDIIAINQGPIIIMIENYRTGSVWNRFMKNTDVQRGLQSAGFLPVTGVEQDPVPGSFGPAQRTVRCNRLFGRFSNSLPLLFSNAIGTALERPLDIQKCRPYEGTAGQRMIAFH